MQLPAEEKQPAKEQCCEFVTTKERGFQPSNAGTILADETYLLGAKNLLVPNLETNDEPDANEPNGPIEELPGENFFGGHEIVDIPKMDDECSDLSASKVELQINLEKLISEEIALSSSSPSSSPSSSSSPGVSIQLLDTCQEAGGDVGAHNDAENDDDDVGSDDDSDVDDERSSRDLNDDGEEIGHDEIEIEKFELDGADLCFVVDDASSSEFQVLLDYSAPRTAPCVVVERPINGITEQWTGTDDHTERKELRPSEEKEEEINPYVFIKNLPPKESLPPSTLARSSATPFLPPLLPSDPQFCLVLDLDETLVHCSTEPLPQPDIVFSVTFNAVEYTVYARKRPHIYEFLSRIAPLFEVVVFTASQEVYADKLLNILDPEKKFIKHRLFRDSCLCVEGNYIKDLSLLGRDLSKVVIVDNSPQAFGYHVDNGIPIGSWFDDDTDTELLNVLTFLETSLLTSSDVRPLLQEKFNLHKLVSHV